MHNPIKSTAWKGVKRAIMHGIFRGNGDLRQSLSKPLEAEALAVSRRRIEFESAAQKKSLIRNRQTRGLLKQLNLDRALTAEGGLTTVSYAKRHVESLYEMLRKSSPV
jgi:hypothetical protein